MQLLSRIVDFESSSGKQDFDRPIYMTCTISHLSGINYVK